MTYTLLTSSTLVSSVPDILNGVTLAAVPGMMHVGPATSSTASVALGVHAFASGIGDKTSLNFTIPPNVDIAVAPTLMLTVAPLTAESSKVVALKYSSDTSSVDSEPTFGAFAQTTTSADYPSTTTIGASQIIEITLSTAVWAAGDPPNGLIVGVLERVAATVGTDLTGDVGVVCACLTYTIER
tara:strand:- start:2061 stop:2612 length:552 start_codon:yes stop_codon:yes gene_type:complete